MNHYLLLVYITLGSYLFSMSMCTKKVIIDEIVENKCVEIQFNEEKGCDGQTYIDPSISPYKLPFRSGTKIKMGLTNCSASFHGSGQPDQYAFDFNFSDGTPFYAARGGTVVKVVENQPSGGGGEGAGNFLVIDHGDETFGLYYHSPEDGILPTVNQEVVQGEKLGDIGRSGLAGYPHLHFIVVRGQYDWPYEGIPISFSNVIPATTILSSGGEYEVCEE